MPEEFEQLNTVEEMLDFLSRKHKETFMPESPKEELLILLVQAMLKLFPAYMKLSEEDRKTFREASLTFNDLGQNTLTRQSALAACCSMLFPEEKSEIKIAKKNKAYPTPCEECEKSPSYKIEFRLDNRLEEHYLCENCEEAARKNFEMGN